MSGSTLEANKVIVVHHKQYHTSCTYCWWNHFLKQGGLIATFGNNFIKVIHDCSRRNSTHSFLSHAGLDCLSDIGSGDGKVVVS